MGRLARGQGCEIVNFIDDHSRLCLASVALPVTTAVDVGAVFQGARAQHGTPASVLTDNGSIYTAEHRGGKVVLETELERLGIQHKRSRPYHPQTCGKVERFHQTLKKYLAKQPAAPSLQALQLQIDRFVTYYNEERPHRALGRLTPREVFDAKLKARPQAKIETHFRIRHDKVDKGGKLSLRYESRLLHIGMGARHKGQPVVMLIAGRDVRVVSAEGGELLRHRDLRDKGKADVFYCWDEATNSAQPMPGSQGHFSKSLRLGKLNTPLRRRIASDIHIKGG